MHGVYNHSYLPDKSLGFYITLIIILFIIYYAICS